MKGWRGLQVGDRLIAVDAAGRPHHVVVEPVPREWRDESGSHGSTTRGWFPKAWVRFADGSVSSWPVDGLVWPNHWPHHYKPSVRS